jgi:hypothetical protein
VSEGEDQEKMEGIKRGVLPYTTFNSTPCNYEFANNDKVSLFSFLY